MTSSVPAIYSYPIIALAIAVVSGRMIVLDRTRSSIRVTAAVSALTVSALMREESIQHLIAGTTGNWLDIQLVRQLSTAFLMLTMVPLVVMGARWVFGQRSEGWAGYIYGAAALSVALLIAVGTPARESGNYIDITAGWETIAYFVIFSVWTAAMATLYLFVSARELARGLLPRRFVSMFIALGLLSLWGVEETFSILFSALLAGTGHPNAFVHWRVEANEFNMTFILLAGALYAAVPVMYRLAEDLGVDHWSRALRTLEPMWQDMTSACPEVLLANQPSDPTPRQRLHRMCIEMRDSLSVLARFRSSSLDEQNDGGRPRAIAEAIREKESGASPSTFRSFEVPSARTLEDEVVVLTSLALAWKQAEISSVRI
nr:MAB_1171c family putative transporter [Rhodococcus sp. 06-621-2]